MGVYDIQGKNCLFQLKIGDEYLTVVCAKSFTFNPVTDMKETTTVGSGFWKEFRPRKLSYTITFNGMLQVISLITQEKIKTMFDYQIQFLPLVYRMLYYDNSGNVMNVNGTVYVTSNLFDASPVNLVNGTTEMQGTGAIEIFDFIQDFISMTVSVTGEADAKTRFILYKADGSVAYDTSILPELLPYGGWLLQGGSVTFDVQKGQYAWGISTDEVESDVNAFDLDITPAAHVDFTEADVDQNSLPTTYDFLTNKTAVFDIGPELPPPGCVPVAFVGTPSLPDAHALSPYTYSFSLTGSTPFSLSNVTKPSWMNISIHESTPGSGVYVVGFGGLPTIGSVGTGITVSFDVTNACGTESLSDTINVTAPLGTPSHIDYSLNFTGGGVHGTLRIYVNSVQTVLTFVEGSGSLDVNAGDIVEAQLTGSTTYTKQLQVDDSISGNLYNNTGTGPQSFTWTAVLGHDYTILADVTL